MKEKLEPVPALRNMSVDEVVWQKWHKYVTNVVDIDKKKVVWNHEGRGKTVLGKFCKKLGKERCKEVEAVACDGAKGFIGATEEYLTNALIVLDHFHVKHYLKDAVELGYKFFRKRHYVLNYFVCKITTAISEGINNKIKRLKRMAYGYRDVISYSRFISIAGYLTLSFQLKNERTVFLNLYRCASHPSP